MFFFLLESLGLLFRSQVYSDMLGWWRSIQRADKGKCRTSRLGIGYNTSHPTGATCNIFNVLDGWSRGQNNEQRNNVPSPKKQRSCRLSGSSEGLMSTDPALLKPLLIIVSKQVSSKGCLFYFILSICIKPNTILHLISFFKICSVLHKLTLSRAEDTESA